MNTEAPLPARPRPAADALAHVVRAAWLRVLVVAAVVLIAVLLWQDQFDAVAVHEFAAQLHGAFVFALLVTLPLVGFPVSILHIAAGVRFGAGLGLVLVSASIALQLLASYGLVYLWRDSFARRFAKIRRRIPPGAHTSISVFAVFLPGAPYFAINYVLPLIGVRLRTYFLCCWPLHTLRSTVTVLFGDQSDEFTPGRLIVLGLYALTLSTGSWWIYRRLHRRLGGLQPAEGDPTQRA